jgi:hypothetical protein
MKTILAILVLGLCSCDSSTSGGKRLFLPRIPWFP